MKDSALFASPVLQDVGMYDDDVGERLTFKEGQEERKHLTSVCGSSRPIKRYWSTEAYAILAALGSDTGTKVVCAT